MHIYMYELGRWSLLVMLAALLLFPVIAGAQNQIPDYNPLSQNQLTDPKGAVGSVGTKIANIIGTIILAVSVIMILFSAFNFLTAGGDTEKVASARNTLIYALVGVAVSLLAYVLPNLVQTLIRG